MCWAVMVEPFHWFSNCLTKSFMVGRYKILRYDVDKNTSQKTKIITAAATRGRKLFDCCCCSILVGDLYPWIKSYCFPGDYYIIYMKFVGIIKKFQVTYLVIYLYPGHVHWPYTSVHHFRFYLEDLFTTLGHILFLFVVFIWQSDSNTPPALK